MEKKTKRSKVKYPGLTHNVNPKTRWELIDHDYVDDLTDEEKSWLSNFNEEYLSGNFTHKGKRLHKTKKAKQACYTRNNARNRDIMTLGRVNNWVSDVEDFGVKNQLEVKTAEISFNHEDIVVALLDIRKVNGEKS